MDNNFGGQNNGNFDPNSVQGDMQNQMMGSFGQQPMDGMQNQAMNNFAQPMNDMQNQAMNNFAQPMNDMQNQAMNNFGQAMDGVQNQAMNGFGLAMDGAQDQAMNNNFAQPMDNFNQPMGGDMGFDSFNGAPVGGGQPPKGNKPKGKKVGLIVGAVALVALIVCAIIFIPKFFMKKPKDVIKDAFNKTFNSASNDAEKFEKEGGEAEFVVTLGDGFKEIGIDGYAISFDAKYDASKKSAAVSAGALYKNDTIVSADFIADGDKYYIRSKEIFDGYFTLPQKDLLNALKNAPLFEGADFGSLDQFEAALESAMNNSAASGLDEETRKAIEKYTKEFQDSIKYEKKGKEKVSVNGNTISAKKYVITVPKDAVIDYVMKVYSEAIKSNPSAASAGVDDKQIKAALGLIIQKDFVANVYIDKDKVVKMTCKDTISIMGASLGYDFDLEVDDKDLFMAFDLSAEGETVGMTADIKTYNTAPNGYVKAYAPGANIQVNISSENADTSTLELVVDGVSYGTIKMSVKAGKPSDISVDGSQPLYDLTTMTQADIDKFGEANKDKAQAWLNSVIEKAGPLAKTFGGSFNVPSVDPNTIDIPDGDDPDVKIDVDPTTEDSSADIKTDDMVLTSGDLNVRILGTLDGYTADYVSNFFISFNNMENGSIEYSISEGLKAQDYINALKAADYSYLGDNIADEDKTFTVDGETVYAKLIKYDFAGQEYKMYFFAKDIDDKGIILLTATSFNDISADDVVQALSSKYYKVEK